MKFGGVMKFINGGKTKRIIQVTFITLFYLSSNTYPIFFTLDKSEVFNQFNLEYLDNSNNQLSSATRIENLASGFTLEKSLPAELKGAGSFYWNGKMFIGGGEGLGDVPSDKVYATTINEKDLALQWDQVWSLPTALDRPLFFRIHKRIYVIGIGRVSGVWSSELIEGGNPLVWRQESALPGGHIYSGGVSVGGSFILFTNDGSLKIYKSVLTPNGYLSVWSECGQLPTGLRDFSVTNYLDQIILVGGINVVGLVQKEIYIGSINSNGLIDSWGNGPSLPIALKQVGLASVPGGILTIGGNTGSTETQDLFLLRLNQSGDSFSEWVKVTGLPVVVQFGAIFANNKSLYVCGGKSLGTLTKDVYRIKLLEMLTDPIITDIENLSGNSSTISSKYSIKGVTYGSYVYTFSDQIYRSKILSADSIPPSFTPLGLLIRPVDAFVNGSYLYLIKYDSRKASLYKLILDSQENILGVTFIEYLGPWDGEMSSLTYWVTHGRIYFTSPLSNNLIRSAAFLSDGNLGPWRDEVRTPNPYTFGVGRCASGNRLYIFGGTGYSGGRNVLYPEIYSIAVNNFGVLTNGWRGEGFLPDNWFFQDGVYADGIDMSKGVIFNSTGFYINKVTLHNSRVTFPINPNSPWTVYNLPSSYYFPIDFKTGIVGGPILMGNVGVAVGKKIDLECNTINGDSILFSSCKGTNFETQSWGYSLKKFTLNSRSYVPEGRANFIIETGTDSFLNTFNWDVDISGNAGITSLFRTSRNNETAFGSPLNIVAGLPVSLSGAIFNAELKFSVTSVENERPSLSAIRLNFISNSYPLIDQITDLTLNEDTTSGIIDFQIGDSETPANNLILTGITSNLSLVPEGNIVFGGSGANRTVTVTPASNQSGTATISITVNDGALTTTKTFVVTVNAINDTPIMAVITDQSISEDSSTGPIVFTVGDLDNDPGSLTLSGTSNNPTLVPEGNIVFGGSGANRTVTVTPASNQSGTANITITVNDGVLTTSKTFTLTVNAVNDAPIMAVITDQSISEDSSTGPIVFTVGDLDNDPGSLTLSGTSNNPTLVPESNIVFGWSGANRTVTVTPTPNQSGTATITVSVNDGTLTTNKTFILTVNMGADAPIIGSIENNTVQEDSVTGPINFIVADIDTPLADLTLSGLSNNPTLVPESDIVFGGSGANRTVTVTPAPNQSGTATITITVNDGVLTTSKTFTLTVNAVNDTPLLASISDQSLNEDNSTGAIAFTVSDVETSAGELTLAGGSNNPTLVPESNIVFGGSGANRTVTVTPTPNQSGTATISITVNDGALTTTKTFVVTVNAVNDTPTLSVISDQSISEDGSTGLVALMLGDLDNDPGSLTLSGTSNNPTLVPEGNIVFGGSGANRTVTVTPTPNQSGTATISITVNDGALTTTKTFVVTVNAINDTPTLSVISDQSISEDGSTGLVALMLGDLDNDPGSLTLSGTSNNPTLVPEGNIVFGGSGANRTVTVTPASNQSGTATISITVNDGALTTTKTFVVTVNAINDTPIMAVITDQSISEDSSTGPIVFTVGDLDNDPGSLTLSGTSNNPTLVPEGNIVFGGSGANRTVTVTPTPNQSGTATISITVNDGFLTTVKTFVVTVNPINNPPTISTFVGKSINEDTKTEAISFIVGDLETPAGALTLVGLSSDQSTVPNRNIVFGGSGANRTVTVTPTANEAKKVTITITVSDGSLTTSKEFTLDIMEINDAPILSAFTDKFITENSSTGAILFTVSDLESPAGELTLTGGSNNPTLVPESNIVFGGSGANRTVTVTPTPNQSGTAIITITVNDGNASTSKSFLLTVNPLGLTITSLERRSTVNSGVKFLVSTGERVHGSLDIRDESQALIRTVDVDIPSGTSEFVWDCRDANGNSVYSGVYWCQFKTNLANKTISVSIIR
jgi:VCBS repeat-containing protein